MAGPRFSQAIAYDPPEPQLNIPWKHPHDIEYDGTTYHVRPRMRAGQLWCGRMVAEVRFAGDPTDWFLEVRYAD